jgi:hypothetical protein
LFDHLCELSQEAGIGKGVMLPLTPFAVSVLISIVR